VEQSERLIKKRKNIMGCYDTIMVPCPKCGELYEAQSKSGDCLLRVFDFNTAPQNVMQNVNRHAPFQCNNCKTIFKVQFNPTPVIVETSEPQDIFEIKNDNNFRDNFEKYLERLDQK
jgi:endogenous inhibitor of DNA gyrase (YacG/DUF329 family)